MQEESTITETLSQHSCTCEAPVAEERPGYKGAARIYCARCDRPVAIRLSH